MANPNNLCELLMMIYHDENIDMYSLIVKIKKLKTNLMALAVLAMKYQVSKTFWNTKYFVIFLIIILRHNIKIILNWEIEFETRNVSETYVPNSAKLRMLHAYILNVHWT